MIEPEIAFADLADDATLAEALLKHIFRTVLAERGPTTWRSSRSASRRADRKLQASSTRIRPHDYTEAIRILEGSKQKFEYPVKWASTCSPSTSAAVREPREEAGDP